MTKAAWKKKIKSACEDAGTYETWCDIVIESLASILEKRDAAENQYRALKSLPVIVHTNKAGASNPTKNPALVVWNDLNTSALAYWRELGLTPSAFRKLTGDALRKERTGGLENALKSLES